MNNTSPTTQRLYRRWYEDGIGEMAQGVLFLLVALYFLAQWRAQGGSQVFVWLSLAFVALILGGGLALGSIVRSLKARITTPRTGYASFRRADRRRRSRLAFRLGLGLGAAFSAASLALALGSGPVEWSYLILGLIISAGMLYAAIRVRLARFGGYAALSALTGCALAVLWPELPGLLIFFAVLGAAQMLTGGLVLAIYLRRHPLLPEDGPQEGEEI